jgi:hypothetical protein
MRRTPLTSSRERGGVILWTILALVLVAGVYYGYKALVFYRANVAPTYKLTRDPGEIATVLQSILRIGPPPGYTGAFGFTFEMLGKSSQMVALIPEGVQASQIFEGGKGEIRFNPGSHTIFLAARSDGGNRDEMRAGIAKMVNGDGQMQPLQPVFIEAGGRRVAAYTGTAENYGTRNKMVFAFLDDNRLVHAAGPVDGFDDAALASFLGAVVATHPANELLYTHPKIARAVAQSDPCGIAGLPDDFDVVVVSVYKGSTPLEVAIDRSGHDVTREEVVVGATPKPVVLVLMGYDPIVWNVGQTADANIAGILAQGYHRQAVMGVSKTTPVITYSAEDGPNACRSFRSERDGDRAVDRRLRELFGRGATTFLNRKAGQRFAVGDVAGDPTYSPDIALASIALPANVMPGGQRGIDRLVKEKAIRLATEEEVAAWIAGAAKRKGQPVAEYRRRMDWRLGRDSVYVVLADFDLPDGLGGANARTFIVPEGASRPGGPQGHCTFLAMENFQCYGTGCS